MARELGVREAAAYLGISSRELVVLHRADLVPWKPGDGLPRFDVTELDAFRPRLKSALRAAHALESQSV
jgi:hypothetical protein